jgi:hypothetical protein
MLSMFSSALVLMAKEYIIQAHYMRGRKAPLAGLCCCYTFGMEHKTELLLLLWFYLAIVVLTAFRDTPATKRVQLLSFFICL